MSEQKHYQYEGHVDLKQKRLDDMVDEIEIKGYQFLVPCKISMKIQGKEVVHMANVNLVDQKIFDLQGKEWEEELSKKFFGHILEVNTLPDDFYSADEETVDSADKAKQDYDEVRNQQYGEGF